MCNIFSNKQLLQKKLFAFTYKLTSFSKLVDLTYERMNGEFGIDVHYYSKIQVYISSGHFYSLELRSLHIQGNMNIWQEFAKKNFLHLTQQ